MPSIVRPMFHYTKSVLEKVSFDVQLFKKELKKAEDDTTLYENEVDKTYDILNTSLSELEKQYPKGEVNLLDGTVTFDNNQ